MRPDTDSLLETSREFLSGFECFLKEKLLKLHSEYIDSSIMLDAVVYSTHTTGGKRIRPLLAFAAARALDAGTSPHQVYNAGAAVEYIHAYSLIHDDLPSMDDDAMRRGMPSCHKKFDEPNAILAGDMLQAMAFECLACSSYTEKKKLQMIGVLSRAAMDMAAGQALDIQQDTQKLSAQDLERYYSLKSGALISAGIKLGALTSNASDADIKILDEIGRDIGLAFQLRDDLLDMETESQEKQCTYPNIVGIEATQERMRALLNRALGKLPCMTGDIDFFRFVLKSMALCEK